MNNKEKIEDKTAGNIEIFPASLLPLKEVWKEILGSLPLGSCLLILPENNPKLLGDLLRLAWAFQESGRKVKILQEQEIVSTPSTTEACQE